MARMASTQDLLTQALNHERAGRLDEAESVYRRILSLDPRHGRSLHQLALLAYKACNFLAAEKLLSQAIALEPSQPAHPNSLGAVLAALGRKDDAIRAFARALE